VALHFKNPTVLIVMDCLMSHFINQRVSLLLDSEKKKAGKKSPAMETNSSKN
jgi:hypothetical protein